MPLAEIPNDPLTEDEHQILDEELAVISLPQLPNNRHYATLLSNIVTGWNEKLTFKSLNKKEALEIIEEMPELREKLESAWKEKSYRSIRILKVLHQPASSLIVRPIGPPEVAKLQSALTADLKGASVKGLYEYLQINNYRYSVAMEPGYYGKFCSIVQSSGTGKTRLMLELVNLEDTDVVVLYMNLRSAKDEEGYPLRDDIPATLLTEVTEQRMNYLTYTFRCRLFFTAIFEIVGNQLEKENGITDEWRKALCQIESPIRAAFFHNLKATYEKRKKKIASDEFELTIDSLDTALQQMRDSYRTMISQFSYRPSDGSKNEPKLVIALDEAHMLHEEPDGFHRAPRLLGTITEYSDRHPVWVLFTSTTSRVAHFASPREVFPSARVRKEGYLVFEPFCQTGWDIYAPKCEAVEYTAVAKTKTIIGYGRPLWHSQYGRWTVQDIFQLAKQKLCGKLDYDPGSDVHALAVLGQRFALEVAFGREDAVAFIDSAVQSHLRVCITTTEDWNWSYTTYPSEPFLSCAAASLLHRDRSSLATALTTLQRKIESGMVEVGERGELVSRLLWLVAKDLFVLQRSAESAKSFKEGPDNSESVLTNCDMVPVVDFLRFVFGGTFWSLEGCSEAEKEFKNAYINFSHWVSMSADIRQMKSDHQPKEFQASLEDFTGRHWKRTSAIQCCHNQPLIDKVIPVYFENDDRVSQIFISDKDRLRQSKRALRNVRRDHYSIGVPDTSDSPAYIVILADLGVDSNPGLSATFRPRKIPRTRKGSHDAPCLRIRAKGMDLNTYPFLKDQPIFDALHGMVKRHIIPTRKRKYSEFLQGQVRFSSSAELRHIQWEDWSETNPERIIQSYRLVPAENVETNTPTDTDTDTDSDTDSDSISPSTTRYMTW